MKRKSITRALRLTVFVHHGGICHWCGHKIDTRKPWDVEHVIPLAMGGPDAFDNMAPIHKACHASKTHKGDVPNIARAKRRELKHRGVKRPRTILGGKRFDGTPIRYARER